MHSHAWRLCLKLGVGVAPALQAAGKVVAFAELPSVLALECTGTPNDSAFRSRHCCFLQAAGKVVAFAELPGVLAPCTRMPGGTVY
jgi:hypothetical protein